MEFYERLRELRKNAGYSQEGLAEVLGVSRQAVSKWESGTTNPDINNLIRLGELYHVSTDYILLGSAPEAEPPTLESSEPIKNQDSLDCGIRFAESKSANGFLWLGLGVLAVLVLYYATNGF